MGLWDDSILSPRLERSQRHLLHSHSSCSVGLSSCSSYKSVSEITTLFSKHFSLFQVLPEVWYSCHWVRNVAFCQGQAWHLDLEVLHHFLPIHSPLLALMKDAAKG